jgi:hypothetical protein
MGVRFPLLALPETPNRFQRFGVFLHSYVELATILPAMTASLVSPPDGADPIGHRDSVED